MRHLLFVTAFVVCCVLLARWTWRRLLRRGPGRDQWERMVYDRGARGLGLPMWAMNAVGLPLWQASERGQPVLSLDVAHQIVICALIGAWIWPWAGYWWGRSTARMLGVRPRARPRGPEDG